MPAAATWGALALALAAPLWLAAQSPLLAWRDGVYIAAGLAGVAGLCLLLVQPLLAAGRLPLGPAAARRWHRAAGMGLVALVVVHVAALWRTSPPDLIDALLLLSPTPFSLWGVIAMWAIFLAALVALLRRHLPRPLWRRGHRALALVIAGGTIAHALLIEGTMEPVSKWLLCAAVAGATLAALIARRTWTR